jgi:hypothetical protein
LAKILKSRRVERSRSDFRAVSRLHRIGVGDDLKQEIPAMKKLAIAFAITALAVSPALAKTKHQQKDLTQTTSDPPGEAAYAYAPGDQPQMQGRSATISVYAYGRYQGADPDPNIRFQLFRDPPTIQW